MWLPEDAMPWIQGHFDALPSMAPDKWCFFEPFNQKPPKNNDWSFLTDFPDFAWTSLYWKRLKKTRSWGGFLPALAKKYHQDSTHASEIFYLEFHQLSLSEVYGYLKRSAEPNHIDIGGCDSFTQEYYDDFFRNVITHAGEMGGEFLLYTRVLQHWLPDLYWITVFGKPYVNLFGLDKLLSAPCYQVEQIGEDAVIMQMTANPQDMLENYSEIRRVKQAVKEHLNPRAFFNQDMAYFIGGEGMFQDYDLVSEQKGSVFDVPRFELKSDRLLNRDWIGNKPPEAD